MVDYVAMALLCVGVLALVGRAAFRLWGDPQAGAKRALRTIAVHPIGEAPVGEVVRVHGKARVAYEDALEAPLTGRRCAGYVVEIFSRNLERRYQHDALREVLLFEANLGELSVVDDTAEAWVDPDGAELLLVRDREEVSFATKKPSARARHLLDEAGIEPELGLRDYVYQEAIIAPNEEIAVVGCIRREVDPTRESDGTYRDRPMRLVIGKGPDGVLRISDDPKVVSGG